MRVAPFASVKSVTAQIVLHWTSACRVFLSEFSATYGDLFLHAAVFTNTLGKSSSRSSDPVALHPVLHAGPWPAALPLVEDLAREAAVELAAEEGEHVLGPQTQRGVPQEPRVE